jgi:hypothetical protein
MPLLKRGNSSNPTGMFIEFKRNHRRGRGPLLFLLPMGPEICVWTQKIVDRDAVFFNDPIPILFPEKVFPVYP